MPAAGSPAHKNWVDNFGDSPDSWLAFTVGFHTKYLQEVDTRIKAITAKLATYPDPNEIISDPNEIRTIMFETPLDWKAKNIRDWQVWNAGETFLMAKHNGLIRTMTLDEVARLDYNDERGYFLCDPDGATAKTD